LQLDALETLTLRHLFWYSLERPYFDIFIPTRPLTAIHLIHLTALRLLEYGAGGALVRDLVKSCPSLTVLEVVWGWDQWSRDHLIETQVLLAFDLIAAAIANHAPKLSMLILDDIHSVDTCLACNIYAPYALANPPSTPTSVTSAFWKHYPSVSSPLASSGLRADLDSS
jgi:hypothetical protein